MTTGTVQGGSLSSNLFNIAQEPMLQEVRQLFSTHDVKIFSIHDGHFILGSPQYAFEALKVLHVKASEIGLISNPSKIRSFTFQTSSEIQYHEDFH